MNKSSATNYLKDNELMLSEAIKLVESKDTDGKMSIVDKKQSLRLRKIQTLEILNDLKDKDKDADEKYVKEVSMNLGLDKKKAELGVTEDKENDFDLRLYERTKYLAINILRDFK